MILITKISFLKEFFFERRLLIKEKKILSTNFSFLKEFFFEEFHYSLWASIITIIFSLAFNEQEKAPVITQKIKMVDQTLFPLG